MDNDSPEQRMKRLVWDALGEIDSLRASIEYDEEYMGNALSFLNDLEAGVRALYEKIESGDYKQGQGELVFMEIVNNVDSHLLPFKHLFNQIQELHTTDNNMDSNTGNK